MDFLAFTFFATYFTGRFLIENFKEIQVASEEGFPLTRGQMLSIIPALVGYYGIYWSMKKRIPAHWYTDADDAGGDEGTEDEGDEEEEVAAEESPEKKAKHDADVDAEFEK